MKRTAFLSAAALAAMLSLGAAPASAQTPGSFSAEIDCDGLFSPGDSVLLGIRLENQTLDAIPLDMRIGLVIPGLGPRPLGQRSVSLGPDQDASGQINLVLPEGAPGGDYTGFITASSPDESTFDTCSFNLL